MPSWRFAPVDEESEEAKSPTPPREARSLSPPRESMDAVVLDSQQEFGPRWVKTCAKRKDADKGKGKADEASKRPKLSSDPEQYLL
jgi:hypothetical protein